MLMPILGKKFKKSFDDTVVVVRHDSVRTLFIKNK